MNHHRQERAFLAVGLFLGAILLSGCGGSSGPLSPEAFSSDQMGNLVITVEQPGAAGRFVPPNTLSVKAFVYVEGDQDPNNFQASATANLPNDIVLTNIPAGPKDVRVWAYDALNGTGNGIAYGVAQVLLLGGRDNSVTVHLVAGRLIFVTDRHGFENNELYRATPDGRLFTRLTYNALMDDYPAASPNGQKIAFECTVGGGIEIRILDNSSFAVSTFANPVGINHSPAWSPDSNTIVWVNYNAGTYTLWKKNLDGSGAASLSFGSSEIFQPVWSPDGSRIALLRYVAPDKEVGVLWANLTGFTLLTSDDASQANPVWSRDGSSIYCSSYVGPYAQLAQLTGNLYPGGSASISPITDEPWDHWLWDISPDGALLACHASPPWIGQSDIYYYSADPYASMPRIRVTYHSGEDLHPAFLPPTTAGGSVDYE